MLLLFLSIKVNDSDASHQVTHRIVLDSPLFSVFKSSILVSAFSNLDSASNSDLAIFFILEDSSSSVTY